MRIFDTKLKNHWKNFIFQCLIAVFCIVIVLLFLDTLYEGTLIASFGATCFIVFLKPNSSESSVRTVLGGHITGVFWGCLFSFILKFEVFSFLTNFHNLDIIIFGAITVGLSMFFMTITDTEHPPAAGLALGLVFDGFTLMTIVIIFSGVICILIIKDILKKHLINLI